MHLHILFEQVLEGMRMEDLPKDRSQEFATKSDIENLKDQIALDLELLPRTITTVIIENFDKQTRWIGGLIVAIAIICLLVY
jgi:hypothetical protein